MKQLDKLVTRLAGFESSYPITGQTYPRLVDVEILSSLSLFGTGVHKVSNKFMYASVFIKIP